ncbi:carbohydrate porin [Lusitaniella coriacea LEGE 07157]|uniref:Carbohydrate porin n=1 Tax=Lusitaniella coriacea LEGE 07157 TaxID=945747 RepID=A0A8J7E157_9CYAN|nr:iron uptake porin [Lusitaniella coriacea]MBE9118591.1 carbohydrate porin [Lusitaniella coriacea LEGE 07157]
MKTTFEKLASSTLLFTALGLLDATFTTAQTVPTFGQTEELSPSTTPLELNSATLDSGLDTLIEPELQKFQTFAQTFNNTEIPQEKTDASEESAESNSETPPFEPLYYLDLNDSDPMAQILDASKFRDVSPGDWAYQALSDLVQRYDCLVGYPDGTFRGNRPLSRYEFAAGLNACLSQLERLIAGLDIDVTRADLEQIDRLITEFNGELAILRGRVDGLEARVTELEGTQFSTTTKLFGQVVVGVQGRTEGSFESQLARLPDNGTEINVITNVQLSLFTQFSPNSLLLTGLQAGNGNTIGGNFNETFVGLSYEGDTNSSLRISDLSYRHLIANKVAVIVGPVGVNAVNVFRGSNRVESAGFGPLSRFAQRNPIISVGSGSAGAGFDWQINNNFSLQGIYSTNLANDAENGGIFGGDQGRTSAGLQLVASPTEDIDIAFQYINSYSPDGRLGTGVGDDLLVVSTLSTINNRLFLRGPIQTNAFGLGAEWRITPTVTVGGWGGFTTSDFKGGSGGVDTYNWMTYVNFPDLLGEGNLAGLYFGQPPKISSSNLPVGRNVPNTFVTTQQKVLAGLLGDAGGQPDTAYHLEAFYRWRLTDNISITPGAIVIFNPGHNSNNDTIGIGAIRATLTF